MKKYQTIIILLFILIISIFPRIWQLTTYPPIIVDEPANLRDVDKLMSMGGFRLFDYEWDFGKATLIHYPSIVLISFGLEEFFALRLTSVILSLLALIPFYFIIKKRTDTLIAFCTTIMFSFSYFYLQFSRVGWTNIHTIVLGLTLFWILDLAIDKKSPILTLLAGSVAGLIMYTYRAGEIYILAGFIYLVINYTSIKDIISKFKNIVIFVSSFLIISFPWLLKIFSNWELYNLRANVVSIRNVNYPYHGLNNNLDIYIYQIITTIKTWVLMLPIYGENVENQRYLPIGKSIVSFPVVLLFIFGLTLAVFNLKKHYVWILIFILGLIFGQILTVNPPNGARGLILLPIIYLFSSFTLFYIYKRFESFKLIKPILIIFSFAVALIDFYFYTQWMTWIKV